jgi:alkylhydroperoxidase family enzyme
VLGRSAGVTDDQLAHLTDDPLPPDIFAGDEAALVHFAQVSTRRVIVDDELYAELAAHFNAEQIMEAVFLVGLSALVNRFHATFLTDVDQETLAALAEGGAACPIPLPPRPSGN